MITFEGIISRENLDRAMNKVIVNKGAPGIDGLRCCDIRQWLYDHPNKLTREIMNGTYKPLPIRRVYIPKEKWWNATSWYSECDWQDRTTSNCAALSEEYDKTFSENSYGFRPARGAHDAVKAVTNYLNDGYTYVVDLDLAKFFDTVSHGKMLQLLSERIQDGRVISLINRILTTKIVDNSTWDSKFVSPRKMKH